MKKFKFNDALGIVFLLYIVSMAVVMLMSFCSDNGNNSKSELEVYKNYYEVTEKVLDELDAKYDIADELSGEYYDIKEVINN